MLLFDGTLGHELIIANSLFLTYACTTCNFKASNQRITCFLHSYSILGEIFSLRILDTFKQTFIHICTGASNFTNKSKHKIRRYLSHLHTESKTQSICVRQCVKIITQLLKRIGIQICFESQIRFSYEKINKTGQKKPKSKNYSHINHHHGLNCAADISCIYFADATFWSYFIHAVKHSSSNCSYASIYADLCVRMCELSEQLNVVV